MRALTLKRKYPTIWKVVEESVFFDVRRLKENYKHLVDKTNAEVISHNAAFVACYEYHKLLKSL